jgi:hypothetical protein
MIENLLAEDLVTVKKELADKFREKGFSDEQATQIASFFASYAHGQHANAASPAQWLREEMPRIFAMTEGKPYLYRYPIRGTFNPDDSNIYYQPAYHGSPYRFDRFSLEHIGKGEGAQAHGWGLYFAKRKKTSEEYREDLAIGETPEEEQIEGTL